MKTKYEIKADKIGAVGDNSRATIILPTKVNERFELLNELTNLSNKARQEAESSEQLAEAKAIESALEAVEDNDENKLKASLQKVGNWTFEIAKQIGAPIVVELLKKTIGL